VDRLCTQCRILYLIRCARKPVDLDCRGVDGHECEGRKHLSMERPVETLDGRGVRRVWRTLSGASGGIAEGGWRTLSGGQWRDWQRWGGRTLSGGQWRDWQRGGGGH
ncbi:unnamed protein product, partial [Staurois parvus]